MSDYNTSMLEIIRISDTKQKLKLFEDYEYDRETWLVSDLKSKYEIQKRLLYKNTLLPENSVLRASELWRKWLAQLRPSLRIVSSDFLKTYLTEKLKQSNIEWAQTPGASKTLLQYLNQLMPVFLDNNGESIMAEWFDKNPQALIRWGHWYHLSKNTWKDLESENITLSQWAPAFLLQEDVKNINFDFSITVDLGSDLSLLEAEILKQLSDSGFNIKVLMPETNWSRNYRECLVAYDFLLGESPESELKPLDVLTTKKIQFSKFATEVSEIKSIVSRVRKLADTKVPLDKIAIVAPDIEKIWPVLSQYLQVEGLPVNKSTVTKLASFTEISSWLSKIRVLMGEVKSSHIESDIYSDETQSPIPFEDYKILYTKVFSELDIRRHKFVEKVYQDKLDSNAMLSRNDFISHSLKLWRTHWPVDRLEVLLSRLCAETMAEQKLTLQSWVTLIQILSSKIEVSVKDAVTSGLHCENICSLEWLNADHVFALSITEKNLNQASTQGISSSDVTKIFTQTGFNLEDSRTRQNEFDLLFFLTNCQSEVVLSTSASDIKGQVNAPSKLWLVGSINNDQWKHAVDPVENSRWDELQNVEFDAVAAEHSWSEETLQRFEKSMSRDLGGRYNLSKNFVKRLSVSQVENYLNCPFIMAAQKVWGLSDLPCLDLDVDRMTTGKLMHALFEELTVEPMTFEYSDKDLERIINECIKAEEVYLADENMHAVLMRNYVHLAKRFLKFEKEWRENFPETQTIAREAKISSFWNTQSKDFASEGDFEFLGFVDRVDKDSVGNLSVIDYKSSVGQAKNHGAWLAEHNLQLAMYTSALEQGLSEVPKGEVLAAHYYVAKTMDRKKGFTVKEPHPKFLPEKNHHLHAISLDSKQELLQKVKEQFNEVAINVKNGNLEPAPEKFENCGACNWKKICRASHLNR